MIGLGLLFLGGAGSAVFTRFEPLPILASPAMKADSHGVVQWTLDSKDLPDPKSTSCAVEVATARDQHVIASIRSGDAILASTELALAGPSREERTIGFIDDGHESLILHVSLRGFRKLCG